MARGTFLDGKNRICGWLGRAAQFIGVGNPTGNLPTQRQKRSSWVVRQYSDECYSLGYIKPFQSAVYRTWPGFVWKPGTFGYVWGISGKKLHPALFGNWIPEQRLAGCGCGRSLKDKRLKSNLKEKSLNDPKVSLKSRPNQIEAWPSRKLRKRD